MAYGHLVLTPTRWCPQSIAFSWCVYNSNFTMIFLGDVSDISIVFMGCINQQTSLRGAPSPKVGDMNFASELME